MQYEKGYQEYKENGETEAHPGGMPFFLHSICIVGLWQRE